MRVSSFDCFPPRLQLSCGPASTPGRSLTLFAVLVGLALPALAQAADFSLIGEVRDKRGTVEIPLRDSIFAPEFPGMTAMGTAMQTGAPVPGGGPATITFPPNIVSDVPTVVRGYPIPIPSIIQVTSTLTHRAPTTTATVMAGRTGPSNFAFCPGAAANPNCTTVAAGGNQGSVNGIIKYTAGPNKFGGTLRMLLSGGGTLTFKGAALPSSTMTPMGATKAALPFSALNNPFGGGAGFVGPGQNYGAQFTTGGVNGTTMTHPYGYMTTPKGLLTPGPVLGFGGPVLNQLTGFPLTTGQVYGYRTLAAQGGPPPSKHTTTGYDDRTPGGIGRILLVGGGLSRTFPLDGSNPPEGSVVDRTTFKLNFIPQPALPLASPATLASLAALILMAAGYAATTRPPR